MSYAQNLKELQPRLRGYVISKVFNKSDVADIVQNANKVAWEKREEYDESRPFEPWILGIGYWQIRAYYKKCKRAREIPTESIYGNSILNFTEQSLESSPLSVTKKIEFNHVEESELTDYTSKQNPHSLCHFHAYPLHMVAEERKALYAQLSSRLTEREQLLFNLIADGNTNESVANKLNLTKNAANTAKSRLLSKLKNQLNIIQLANKYDYQAI